MKAFLRTRPFLSLAVATIALGLLWHLSGLNKEDNPALYAVVYALGLPFITVTQVMHSAIQSRALAGMLSLAFGVLPYLVADWLLRRGHWATLGWFAGSAAFALGMVLVDRAFWWQCGGVSSRELGERWLCEHAAGLRVASAVIAGALAGLLAGRRGLAVGGIAALAGVVLVSFAYRPMIALNAAGIMDGVLRFVVPCAIAGLLGAWLARRKTGA